MCSGSVFHQDATSCQVPFLTEFAIHAVFYLHQSRHVVASCGVAFDGKGFAWGPAQLAAWTSNSLPSIERQQHNRLPVKQPLKVKQAEAVLQ